MATVTQAASRMLNASAPSRTTAKPRAVSQRVNPSTVHGSSTLMRKAPVTRQYRRTK